MGISLQKINEFRLLRDKQVKNSGTKTLPIKKTEKEIVKDKVDFETTECQIKRDFKKELFKLSSATKSEFKVDGLNLPLLPFQLAGVEYINKLNGRALNADEMGCVGGDTVLEIRRSVGKKARPKKEKILIKSLYKKFNGISKNNWPLGTRVFSHCYNTDIRRTWVKEILAVVYSGSKKVYRLDLTNTVIFLTGDHGVYTTKGVIEAKNLKSGDCVLSIDYFSPDFKYQFVISSEETNTVMETYDIVMAPPFHSFVGNGILLKNSGKSVQSLAWVYYKKAFPLLIVCPAHLKYNWQDEVKKWLNESITCDVITSKNKILPESDISIINYDILKRFEIQIQQKEYKTLILDESHYLKSYKSLRTKSAVKIAKKIPHIIALSGTPFLNKPIELFNTLNIVDSSKFSSFFKYAYSYCDPKVTPWGKTFNGATKTSELNRLLRESIMVRRDKKTILPQLPKKTSTLVRLEPSSLTNYNKIFNDKDLDILPKMGQLRQEAVRCKIKQFTEWCQNFLDSSNEKLLVFAHHQEFILQLETSLKKYGIVVLTGKQNAEVKHELVKQFQTSKNKRVAIGSMRAINAGYNITATSTVAFLELDWNYAIISQCYSRVHRIGQKNHVNIFYFIANNTIDEHIYFLISNKLKAFDSVFDGGKGTEVVDKEANIKSELAKILRSQLK